MEGEKSKHLQERRVMQSGILLQTPAHSWCPLDNIANEVGGEERVADKCTTDEPLDAGGKYPQWSQLSSSKRMEKNNPLNCCFFLINYQHQHQPDLQTQTTLHFGDNKILTRMMPPPRSLKVSG